MTSDDVRQASLCTLPRVEHIWVLVQARYHLLIETSRRRMVYRMNYSYLYKIKADKKLSTETRRCLTAATLGSRDKLGGADWITSARDHADGVSLKETEKKKQFCSLPVKYFAMLFPDCTQNSS